VNAAPTLGELALQARVISAEDLDESLRFQRQNYLEGDFRRLGEILVDHARCDRRAIRDLLSRQGITIVECELCETRYNALLFRATGTCLRCGRRLRPSDGESPLTVEDAIADSNPEAQRLLGEYRQRNPRIGRYEILGEVGRGGMGVIYKAWETKLQRHVALKFLRPYDDPSHEDRERFRMEARAVAQLRHENIVQAHAIEEVNGLVYMSMDFVQGVPMDLLANQGALSSLQIVKAAAGIARALHYAHGQGILHRDVKPANVVMDRDLKPYLVDFGIAKNISESMSLTTDGEVLGSLAYMAPEYVAKGKSVLDHRCDVYGLGVVLYETITRGKLPYGDPDDDMMILRLVKEPPIPIQKVYPQIDTDLANLVNRAIAKDRAVRHDSAKELEESLEAYYAMAKRVGGSARFKKGKSPFSKGLDQQMLKATEEQSPVKREKKPSASYDASGAPAKGSKLVVILLAVTAALLALSLGASSMKVVSLRKDVERLRHKAGAALLEAASAYERAGDSKAAEDACTRAALLRPDDPTILEQRARLREARGDSEGAIADRAAAKALAAED
jgi:serine/threonine protein kinase